MTVTPTRLVLLNGLALSLFLALRLVVFPDPEAPGPVSQAAPLPRTEIPPTRDPGYQPEPPPKAWEIRSGTLTRKLAPDEAILFATPRPLSLALAGEEQGELPEPPSDSDPGLELSDPPEEGSLSNSVVELAPAPASVEVPPAPSSGTVELAAKAPEVPEATEPELASRELEARILPRAEDLPRLPRASTLEAPPQGIPSGALENAGGHAEALPSPEVEFEPSPEAPEDALEEAGSNHEVHLAALPPPESQPEPAVESEAEAQESWESGAEDEGAEDLPAEPEEATEAAPEEALSQGEARSTLEVYRAAIQKANHLIATNYNTQARRVLDEVLKLEDLVGAQRARLLFLKAKVERRKGNASLAARLYAQAIDFDPPGVRPKNSLAWLRAVAKKKPLRNVEVALQLAKEVVRDGGRWAQYLDTLARCYFEAGKVEKALEIQLEAVQKHPKHKGFQKRLDWYTGEAKKRGQLAFRSRANSEVSSSSF